ncbi:MAG TPA: YqaA family protein [Methylotenera sp.]|nr:YqaA family protein [Methylotenera sp.]HPN01922.1 YqaA family protein [Methylotenera sp.]
MEYLLEFGYFGLFTAAFLAATILPLSSEVILSGMLLKGLSPIALIAIATIGNTLGSLTNYALGYWASQEAIKKWLKMSDDDIASAQHRYEKYGILSLCFSWVPIIGDPLTVVAGILRIRLMWFLLLVTVGKLTRYIVLGYIVLNSSIT